METSRKRRGGGFSSTAVKRPEYADEADYAAAVHGFSPSSMPPLATDSQRSIVVVDSQGFSSEPGPGTARDECNMAEKAALIANARTDLARAEAAEPAEANCVQTPRRASDDGQAQN
jgi:hypothetical protein